MGSAPENDTGNTPRGAAGSQFPGKLHDLMTYTEQQGLEHIISWVQNGFAIMVHDPEKLLEILPLFGFGQTKYRSFQRQLNMWHWERIADGPFKGGWKHPYFLRGNKLLCSYMSRRMLCDPSIPTELLVKCLARSSQGNENRDTDDALGQQPDSWADSLDAKVIDPAFAPKPINDSRIQSSPKVDKGFHLFTPCMDRAPVMDPLPLSVLDPSYGFPQEEMSSLLEPLPADAFDTLF